MNWGLTKLPKHDIISTTKGKENPKHQKGNDTMMNGKNNNERKRVIIREEYSDSDPGARYLLTEDQINLLHRLQRDGYLVEDYCVIVVDNEDQWNIV